MINEEKLLQDCQELYKKFYSINENKHIVGYKESIVKMFNELDGQVSINYYNAHVIEVRGNIGRYEIDMDLSYDDITLEFIKLSEELIFDYYLDNGGNTYIDIVDFAKLLKNEIYA